MQGWGKGEVSRSHMSGVSSLHVVSASRRFLHSSTVMPQLRFLPAQTLFTFYSYQVMLKKELNVSTCFLSPTEIRTPHLALPARPCSLRHPAATASNYGSAQWSVQKLFILLSPVRLQRNLISDSLKNREPETVN